MEEPAAVLRIRDHGVEIPNAMLTRVFDLFTRLETGEKASASGPGVGLSLVRRLVEAHGGSVEARSEGDGRGSESVVHLPLTAEEPKRTGRREEGPNVP